jgi:hypothetical protein
MVSARKKVLEDYAKDVEKGLPFAEDYIKKTPDIYDNALSARNLSEEALAQKVLDNTGIPIPDKTSSLSRKEDFLNQILNERYPEFEPKMSFKDMNGSVGEYQGGKIFLNKNLAKDRDIQKLTADVFHEGAHKYDDVKKIIPTITQDDFNKELRKLKSSGFDLKNADPAQVYELIAKNHHAQIPNLREGTFGLGALKNYLKSGTFKALPIVGPAIGAAAALSSGDVSAAVPILSEAESLGPEKGSEDYAIENPQRDPAVRRAVLERLLRK